MHVPGQPLRSITLVCNCQHRLIDILRATCIDYLGCELPVDAVIWGAQRNMELGHQTARTALTDPTLKLQLQGQGCIHSVSVRWPDNAATKAMPGQPQLTRSSKPAGLQKLRVGTRYSGTSQTVMGYHSSSTFKEKQRKGVYQHTVGKYKQKEYRDAMQTPQLSASDTDQLKECVLVVENHGGVDERFRVRLSGSSEQLHNWRHSVTQLDTERTWRSSKSTLPFPVFIPSKGRSRESNLNWEADHVFGPVSAERQTQYGGIFPVVCVVVEPGQEKDYREAWPHLLMLVLPEDKRGPGYARWVVQQVCTKAFEWVPSPTAPSAKAPAKGSAEDEPDMMWDEQKRSRHRRRRYGSWEMRRCPLCWIADDNITGMYRMKRIKAGNTRGRAQRVREREAPEGEAMFWSAMLSVQNHSAWSRIAVSGFLRDDGTAVCKKTDWTEDVLSVYKVVLLNLGELQRLEVEYFQDVQRFEDICLTYQVLKQGGRTLKCQAFAFRASMPKRGGCAEQRNAAHGTGHATQLADLIDQRKYNRMTYKDRSIINDVLDWVNDKEKVQKRKEHHLGTPPAKCARRKSGSPCRSESTSTSVV